MDAKSYFKVAGGGVRVKVVHVVDAVADTVINDRDAVLFPRLVATLRKSRERSSTRVYPREFEALNPVPTVDVVSVEEAEKFVEIVKKRANVSPYERAVKIGFENDVYIVALEHACG
ncbi:MAG: hypothetical protein NZ581_00585 [Candidatus Caldarchaeum sp.]|nr:hypothetical protein [Candidatus Caldarchaeum sp.]MDW8434684.1 hypothetical protein [Candidatus Caldarchaeum sp.]